LRAQPINCQNPDSYERVRKNAQTAGEILSAAKDLFGGLQVRVWIEAMFKGPLT